MVSRLIVKGRERAESLMSDSCRVTRATGGTVVDPETGRDIPAVVTVYVGRCKVSSTPQAGERRESGEGEFTVEAPRLHLPFDVPVRTGDGFVIESSEVSPNNVGVRGTLRDLNRGTYRTAQRWNVEVITS